MALQTMVTTDSGLVAKESYVRIDSITGNKNYMQLLVNSYIDKEGYKSGLAYFKQELYYFTPNLTDGAFNFLKQGYEYLKTLNNFTNAIDILEED